MPYNVLQWNIIIFKHCQSLVLWLILALIEDKMALCIETGTYCQLYQYCRRLCHRH